MSSTEGHDMHACRAIHGADADTSHGADADTNDVDCELCEAESPRLEEVASLIAGTAVTPAPYGLRARVLNAALERRSSPWGASPVPAVSAAEAFRETLDAMQSLLPTLDDGDWTVATAAPWNARGILTHLEVVDAIALSCLRREPAVGGGVEEQTNDLVAARSAWTNTRIKDAWLNNANELLQLARTLDSATTVQYFGMPLTIDQVLVDRAFETWLHGQDIRRACGRSVEEPSAGTLMTLTDLGARLLPMVLDQLTVPDESNRETPTVRLVLDGPGGGSWMLGFGSSAPAEEVAATVTMQPIDFCLLIGDRLDPADLAYAVEGEPGLAKSVISAARSLSRA